MTSMTTTGRVLAMSLIVLAGCAKGQAADGEANGEAGSKAAAPTSYTLATGTVIDAALDVTISSRQAKAGDTFTASVVEDVMSGGVAVAIPAGSVVRGTITEVSPAPNSRSTGTLTLAVNTVTVHGQTYDLDASIDSLETVHKGRGVENVDVARTAGGAAAGAVLGRVIGGNAKGTAVGAVIGAGTGVIVSEVMKDMDIVLPAGALLVLTLRHQLAVGAK